MEGLSIEFYSLMEILFKSSNIVCHKVNINDNIWFSGRDIFNLLSYNTDKKKFFKCVSNLNSNNKLIVKDILAIINEDNPEYKYFNSLKKKYHNAVYIDKNALYKLIICSESPLVERIKEFIIEKIFPFLENYSNSNSNNIENLLRNLERKNLELLELVKKQDRNLNNNNQDYVNMMSPY